MKYSISNTEDIDMVPLAHADLLNLVNQQTLAESRVNLIVNNLLVKQVLATRDAVEDIRQKMLI